MQKDVEKMRRRIKESVLDGSLEEARALFNSWMDLLDELIVPPHQDFINVRRGMRNCLWLQTPNVVKVREDELLKKTKERYREKHKQ